MTKSNACDSDSEKNSNQLLKNLTEGDDQAVAEIFEQSMARLQRMIAKRIPNDLRRHTDEEDVALSVMNSFFCGVRQGDRFQKLDDQNDLWQILGMLTKQKLAKHIRRQKAQKRGSGDVRGESIFTTQDDTSTAGGIENHAITQNDGLDALVGNEEIDMLMARLDSEALREIAMLKLQGYEHEEIAKQLEISVRTVGRKLQSIRDSWEKGVADYS
jgi:RNA polymerase sigma factor (sigma-70 family)